MPPFVVKSPIDFDANRRAMVQAVALGTGLPTTQVIMAEGETMNWSRPKAPYVAILVASASSKMGFDWQVPVADAPGDATGLHAFQGVRTMGAGFDAFGRSHEEAYGLMAAFQASLEYPPVVSLLQAAGLAVWSIGDVADISATLATTYEGRAHLDVIFGMIASTTLDLGRIDYVPLTGVVAQDGGLSVTVGPETISRDS